MELIKPSFEIIEQNYTPDIMSGVYAHIATCARVCYQSDKKKKDETDKDFVYRTLLAHEPIDSEKNHLAMLEHATIYLDYLGDVFGDELVTFYKQNPYSKVRYTFAQPVQLNEQGVGLCVWHITTNMRVIVENNLFEDLYYAVPPTENHYHRVTVSFITNIGVSREFNRHRVDSIAEESTRYCNYFKNNAIRCVKPDWLTDEDLISVNNGDSKARLACYIREAQTLDEYDWSAIDYYLFALDVAEFCYNHLIHLGWKAQQAREVLPLATKTQLIHTAFVDDWKHFFALRAVGISGAPHPNARALAKPLMEEFIKLNYRD